MHSVAKNKLETPSVHLWITNEIGTPTPTRAPDNHFITNAILTNKYICIYIYIYIYYECQFTKFLRLRRGLVFRRWNWWCRVWTYKAGWQQYSMALTFERNQMGVAWRKWSGINDTGNLSKSTVARDSCSMKCHKSARTNRGPWCRSLVPCWCNVFLHSVKCPGW